MQDQTAARLVGIDVNRVAALTFGIGVAVTAAGGMVYGSVNAFNPNSGYDLISRLLAIIILGGLGSIGGRAGGGRIHDHPGVGGRRDLVAELGHRGVLRRARARAQRPPDRHLFGKKEARAQ